MAQKCSSETEVILEIEGTAVKCNKRELIQHSDYFKAMFDGSFIESHKKVVKLQDISLKSVNIILSLLWDMDNTVLIEEDEDVLSVLQTSCMLQFVEVQAMCVKRLTDILRPSNSLKIWLLAQQLDLNPLYLKAKNLSLIEFDSIKSLDCILELNIKELYCYLANTQLQCESEIDVFQACMKWWYHNSHKYKEDNQNTESICTEMFTCFLSCLDFTKISNFDIQEIVTFPDFSRNNEVVNILNCIMDIKRGIDGKYSESVLDKASTFLKSKTRNCGKLVCILAHDELNYNNLKKAKTHFSEKKSIVYYDDDNKSFKKLLNLDNEKCDKLEGFQIIGYKELLFLFGGEYIMGQGSWNRNFWVYDSIRESWERKSVLPFVRRHFQTCIAGKYLFIIGGTGHYRVIQDNIFWYNYKMDRWSKLITLPCPGRQLKCCSWDEQLLIVNMNEKCAYRFNIDNETWNKVDIYDDQQLLSNFSGEFSAFSYKSKIYIKSYCLYELLPEDQKLTVVDRTMLQVDMYDEQDCITSDNMIYTLYKHPRINERDDNRTMSFELYNLDTGTARFIFRKVPEGTMLSRDVPAYLHIWSTVLGLQHHVLVAKDCFVNDLT